MIKIDLANEPTSFDQNVRVPGSDYLASLAGSPVDFSNREYWRRCLTDLHSAYNSICAYTCHWIPLDTGSDTVEHFVAKKTDPDLAYEWSNFRLVCGRLNSRKGIHSDVVDPFAVSPGMFELDFPSLQIMEGLNIGARKSSLALSTISRLKLNDERCLRMRQQYVEELRDGHISFDYLERHAPFLAYEIDRQGIRNNLHTVMKSFLN